LTELLEKWKDGTLEIDDVITYVLEHGQGPAFVETPPVGTTIAYAIYNIYLWSRHGQVSKLSGGLAKIVDNDLNGAWNRLDGLHWKYIGVILDYFHAYAPGNWNKQTASLTWGYEDIKELFEKHVGRKPTHEEFYEVLYELESHLEDLSSNGNQILRDIVIQYKKK